MMYRQFTTLTVHTEGHIENKSTCGVLTRKCAPMDGIFTLIPTQPFNLMLAMSSVHFGL